MNLHFRKVYFKLYILLLLLVELSQGLRVEKQAELQEDITPKNNVDLRQSLEDVVTVIRAFQKKLQTQATEIETLKNIASKFLESTTAPTLDLNTKIVEHEKSLQEKSNEISELNTKLTEQEAHSEERAIQMSATFHEMLNQIQKQISEQVDLRFTKLEIGHVKVNDSLNKLEASFQTKLTTVPSNVSNVPTPAYLVEADLEMAIAKVEERSNSKIEALDTRVMKTEQDIETIETKQANADEEFKSRLDAIQKSVKQTKREPPRRQIVSSASSVYAQSDFTPISQSVAELNETIRTLEGQTKNQRLELSSHVQFAALSISGIRQEISQQTLTIQSMQTAISELNSTQNDFKSDCMALEKKLHYLQGPKHTAKASFYEQTNFRGVWEQLAFDTCLVHEECCRNLVGLDNISSSINTYGTCVSVYLEKNCEGPSRNYAPGTAYPHSGLGDFDNLISSAKPC